MPHENSRKPIKFRSDLITGLLKNQGDHIGHLVRGLDITEPITLCQGYGVGLSVPLRVLAYAVPVLRLARQLPRETQIELYWATNGVLRANPAYDPRVIARNSLIARRLLEAYINSFHSDLKAQVRLLEDTRLDERANEAVTALMPTAIAVTEATPSIRSFITNRGGESALRYMIEHALYMRDPIQVGETVLPLIVGGMEHPVGQLMMVGGPAEGVFWRLRQGMLQRLSRHDRWKSHQLFTHIGDPPTYHAQEGEPNARMGGYVNYHRPSWGWEDGIAYHLRRLPVEVRTGVTNDWLVLLQDVATRGMTQNHASATFRIEARRVLAGTLTVEETSMLQGASHHLHEWLTRKEAFTALNGHGFIESVMP